MASRALLLLIAPSNHFFINPQRPILHRNSNFTRKFSAKAENESPLESPDLPRLAETARITLTPQEIEEFAPKIQQVIDWFGQLQAVDINNVEPALRAETKGDNLRDDIPETFEKMKKRLLEQMMSGFNSTIRRLKVVSPLSLKVSLRSIREGRFETLDQCLAREYRITLQAISQQISGDFCEGIRARMVDKDLQPKWNSPRLEQVSEDMVDHYFSPVSDLEPELDLPTKQREDIF